MTACALMGLFFWGISVWRDTTKRPCVLIPCGHVMPHSDIKIWVIIDSGNRLLPDGPKPLPKSMLANHIMCSLAYTKGNGSGNLYRNITAMYWKLNISYESHIPRGQWLNRQDYLLASDSNILLWFYSKLYQNQRFVVRFAYRAQYCTTW